MKKHKHKKVSYKARSARISLFRSVRVFIRRAVFMSFAITMLLTIIFISFLWYDSDIQKFFEDQKQEFALYIADFGNANNNLRLKHIFLEGQHYTKMEHILSTMNLEIGQPLMAISLVDIKERLEDMKWIKNVAIERHLPGGLHIHILERFPVALWQKNKKLYIIDKDGEIIDDSNIGNFADYPIVIGEDAPLHVNELLSFVNSNGMIKERFSSATRVGMRRWDLHLRNGVIIKLPESDLELAWKNLEKLNKKEMVLDKKIESIDLRIPNRISVRNPPKGQDS